MLFKRIKFSEITLNRISKFFFRKFKKIPSILTWHFSTFSADNKLKLSTYENIHSGKTCILVANGPSLKETKLDNTENIVKFGLNRINLAFNEFNFKVDYIVAVNKHVLNQFGTEILNQNIPSFFNWECRNLFGSKPNYIFRGLNTNKFSKDLRRGINPSATVTYAALQIIYYMGFKKVLIVGLDHSFKTKTKFVNKTELRNEDLDVNHFNKNYFPKGVKWETPDLFSSEFYYKIADNEFKKDGRIIIDCTINGKCNIFKKGELRDYI